MYFACRTNFASGDSTPGIRVRNKDDVSPLCKLEEVAYTRLTKAKLVQSKKENVVSCRTGGRDIVLVKATVAKKKASEVKPDTSRKKVSEIDAHRVISSGGLKEAIHQQGFEIKHANKARKKSVLASANIKQPKLSAKESLAMKVNLNMTGNQQKKFRKSLRSIGVALDSEREEKSLREEVMCANISIDYVRDYTADTELYVPVGIVGKGDMNGYISNVINMLDEEKMLTWHGQIPDDEI